MTKELVNFNFVLTAQESQDLFMLLNSCVTAKLSTIRKVMTNSEFSEETKKDIIASLENDIDYIINLEAKIQPKETT